MKEFFAICDYFGLTPQQFFDESEKHPALVQRALNGLKELSEEDLRMVVDIIERFAK